MSLKDWFINPPKKKPEVAEQSTPTEAAVAVAGSSATSDEERLLATFSPVERLLYDFFKGRDEAIAAKVDELEKNLENTVLILADLRTNGNGHKVTTADFLNSLGEHTESPEIAELKAGCFAAGEPAKPKHSNLRQFTDEDRKKAAEARRQKQNGERQEAGNAQ